MNNQEILRVNRRDFMWLAFASAGALLLPACGAVVGIETFDEECPSWFDSKKCNKQVDILQSQNRYDVVLGDWSMVEVGTQGSKFVILNPVNVTITNESGEKINNIDERMFASGTTLYAKKEVEGKASFRISAVDQYSDTLHLTLTYVKHSTATPTPEFEPDEPSVPEVTPTPAITKDMQITPIASPAIHKVP